jgi:glutamine amidotransferase PdxT
MSIHQVNTLAKCKDKMKISLVCPLLEIKKNSNLATFDQMIVPSGNSSKAISMKKKKDLKPKRNSQKKFKK